MSLTLAIKGHNSTQSWRYSVHLNRIRPGHQNAIYCNETLHAEEAKKLLLRHVLPQGQDASQAGRCLKFAEVSERGLGRIFLTQTGSYAGGFRTSGRGLC